MMRRTELWHLRLRRAAIVLSGALIGLALLMFLGMQVSETNGGATELIDGRGDTIALLLPIALFLIGAIGLMAALAWRPQQRTPPD